MKKFVDKFIQEILISNPGGAYMYYPSLVAVITLFQPRFTSPYDNIFNSIASLFCEHQEPVLHTLYGTAIYFKSAIEV